jgi:hypothetical protein
VVVLLGEFVFKSTPVEQQLSENAGGVLLKNKSPEPGCWLGASKVNGAIRVYPCSGTRFSGCAAASLLLLSLLLLFGGTR